MISCCYREIMFSQESYKLDFSFSCKNICGKVLCIFVQEKNLLRFVHTFLFLFFGGWLSHNVSQNHLLHHGYMIRLWCTFYSKNKTLLTWSSWSRLYSSLNFPEKTKLCYFSFYTGKIPWTFLPSLVYLASRPSFFLRIWAILALFCFWDSP